MKQEFINFLKARRAYSVFMRNRRISMELIFNYQPISSWISCAFIWHNMKYWKNLSQQWEDHVSKIESGEYEL